MECVACNSHPSVLATSVPAPVGHIKIPRAERRLWGSAAASSQAAAGSRRKPAGGCGRWGDLPAAVLDGAFSPPVGLGAVQYGFTNASEPVTIGVTNASNRRLRIS